MNRLNNKYLIEAKKAIKRGDRQTGLWLAGKSILRYPKHVDGWLIFGGLTDPCIGLDYLRKAKLLAPHDTIVKRAIQWAIDQSFDDTDSEETSPEENQAASGPAESSDNQPPADKNIKSFRIFKRKSATDNLICPYLGLRKDMTTALGYSSVWNTCHRADPASTPVLSHQCSTCLTPLYVNCPVYNSPAKQKLPKTIKHKSFYPFW